MLHFGLSVKNYLRLVKFIIEGFEVYGDTCILRMRRSNAESLEPIRDRCCIRT